MDRSAETFVLRGGGCIAEMFFFSSAPWEVPAESVLLAMQHETISWAFTDIAILIFLFQKCE